MQTLEVQACTHRQGRNVRKIGGNTRSVDDIIESQFGDQGAGLQEEGQRLLKESLVLFIFHTLAHRSLYLANTTGSTEYNCCRTKGQ